MPVYRPLIGLDKEEIVVAAKKIGTYETSILPYEDGCTIFTKFDTDFDLVSGRYVIDAKSIMGIFSLDLSKPIDLNKHSEEGGKRKLFRFSDRREYWTGSKSNNAQFICYECSLYNACLSSVLLFHLYMVEHENKLHLKQPLF